MALVIKLSLAVRGGALACLGAVAWGCGPGLEMKHESNLRFEHCYRLDMDPRIAWQHREHCWRDWTERYTVDQPLDRIEYARRRIADMESGETRVLSIHEAPRPRDRVFAEVGTEGETPMAAPAPTSAHAPPPKTEPVAPPPPPPSASVRPGSSCAEECGKAGDACDRLCAAKQADCATCREDYRACMRRCFE